MRPPFRYTTNVQIRYGKTYPQAQRLGENWGQIDFFLYESTTVRRLNNQKRLNLQQVPVRETRGAVCQFTWTPAAGQELEVDDIFFEQATPAGIQDYAIYIRSPENTFSDHAQTLFDEILRTF